MRDGCENINRAIAIVHQSENWSAPERSAHRYAEYERTFRSMQRICRLCLYLLELSRKALRTGTSEVIPVSRQGEANRLEKKTGCWSGKRDLNSRPSPWQGDALPLSYSRSITVIQRDGILLMQQPSCQAFWYAPRIIAIVILIALHLLQLLKSATKW
jgi:hypothetical protein